jgi:hypothetical protein
MSNYNLKAKNKITGIIEQFTVIDEGITYHFLQNGNEYLNKDKFNELYEEVIMPIIGNNTWEDKFNMQFVDEDTGLLNISKYDHERLINFIKNETS